MKNVIIKVSSFIMALAFVLQMIPMSTYAASSNSYSEELNFITSKGYLIGTVLDTYSIENGVVFKVNYLSNGEDSFIKYENDVDGIRITIIEGEKQDEIFYKNNGQIYVDGERDSILESLNSSANSRIIMPKAVYATSLYATFEEVPGYNYWRTQTFGHPSELDRLVFQVMWDQTTNFITSKIVAFYGASTIYKAIFSEIAEDTLNKILQDGVGSAMLELYTNTKYIYNSTTLQYLYEMDATYTVLGLTGNKRFYKLESYN